MKYLHFVGFWLLVSSLTSPSAFALMLSSEQATQRESAETIKLAAKSFLNKQFSGNMADIEIHLGNVDPRLNLPKCTETLEGFLPRGGQLKGNAVIGIRCVGSKSWQIYLPVRLKITQSILVFNRSLPRGHTISEKDLEFKLQDVTQLRGVPIDNKKALIGAQLKREVHQGTLAQQRIACMVCKGDKLVITTASLRFSVSMEGTALEDGFYGQEIRIKNSNTSRVIDGTVIAKDRVAVNM